jgi:hypothetical protein
MKRSRRLFLSPIDYDTNLVDAQMNMQEMRERGEIPEMHEILGYDPDDPGSCERYLLKFFSPRIVAEALQERFPGYRPFSGFAKIAELREYLSMFHHNSEVQRYIDEMPIL